MLPHVPPLFKINLVPKVEVRELLVEGGPPPLFQINLVPKVEVGELLVEGGQGIPCCLPLRQYFPLDEQVQVLWPSLLSLTCTLDGCGPDQKFKLLREVWRKGVSG